MTISAQAMPSEPARLRHSKRSLRAVQAPGKPPRDRSRVLSEPVMSGRTLQRIQLVRYRGMWMCLAVASEAIGVSWHSLRAWARSGPDIDAKVDRWVAVRAHAEEVRKAAEETGIKYQVLRNRERKGDPQALTRAVRKYRKCGFAERARELAKDSPFSVTTIRERLRRGWPDELAKTAPHGKWGPFARVSSEKALAAALAAMPDSTVSAKTIYCRMRRGWTQDEARLIPWGMR